MWISELFLSRMLLQKEKDRRSDVDDSFVRMVPCLAQRGMSSSKRPLPAGSHETTKRQALSNALGSAGKFVPKLGLARALLSLHESGYLDPSLLGNEEVSERNARAKLQEVAVHDSEIRTPYGTVVQTMTLPMVGTNDAFVWHYVSPFALLHHICTLSSTFASIVGSHLAQQTNNIMLYFDETKPGNVLRPDPGREFMAIFWTFRELPEYLRHRVIGWFPFGFLRQTKMNQLVGGVSALASRVIRAFFGSSGFNFQLGCRCLVNGVDVYIRAGLGGILADEKGLKQVYDVKGSSGTKPCLVCKNMTSKHKDLSGHGYFVGLHCSKYASLDRHSDESFYEMVDLLLEKQPHLKKGEFQKYCQVLGLNFSPEGLLFQPDLRPLVKPVTGTFWDWMHVLVSGGLADVELGLFTQRIVAEGIPLSKIEAFVLQFQGFKGGPFGKNFLTRRLTGDGSAYHGFAGELLSLLPIMRLFADRVLKPSGLVQEHIACYELLCDIVEFMSLGDRAVQHTAWLRATIEKHHELYVACYGKAACQPKFHYAMHLPDVLDRFGVNMSCFVTERKHRLSKCVAARTFNLFEQVLLTDYLFHYLRDFLEEAPLAVESMGKTLPVRDSAIIDGFAELFSEVLSVEAGASAILAVGSVKRKDVVLLQVDEGWHVGEVTGFYKLKLPASVRFMVHVLILEAVKRPRWQLRSGDSRIFSTECVRAILAFAPLGGGEVLLVEPLLMRSPMQ